MLGAVLFPKNRFGDWAKQTTVTQWAEPDRL